MHKQSDSVKPRMVAVAIPCQSKAGVAQAATPHDILVCLVSSRKHSGKFVLPKGGVEEGEDTYQAAVRELWEEGECQVLGVSRHFTQLTPFLLQLDSLQALKARRSRKQ